jgi:hypothetical protein
MGLFDWLVAPRNPTKDWPVHGEMPAFDVHTRRFGSLRFGDDLDSLRPVGRPDKCRYLRRPGAWCLEYDSRGYNVNVSANRFVDVFFEIGAGGDYQLKPNTPKSRPLISGGERLHGDIWRHDRFRHHSYLRPSRFRPRGTRS